MAVTMRELSNPRRNVNDRPLARSENVEGRCLCGKRVTLNPEGHPVGPVSAHRPPATVHAVKDGEPVPMNRKTRKAAWCGVPAIIAKATAAGLATIN